MEDICLGRDERGEIMQSKPDLCLRFGVLRIPNTIHVFAYIGVLHWSMYRHIPAQSKRSRLEAFVDLKVAGGDLLEGPG